MKNKEQISACKGFSKRAISLFIAVFTITAFPQDFLPSSYWFVGPNIKNAIYGQAYTYKPVSGFNSGFRTRLMPDYLRELKKQGVSKEIQYLDDRIAEVFYYNEDGLPIKHESKFLKEVQILEYDSNQLPKSVTSVAENSKKSVFSIMRDSSGRIMYVESDSVKFRYNYRNSGELESIVSSDPTLTVFTRKKDRWITPGLALAFDADSIEYDKYGQELMLKYAFDITEGNGKYDKAGRLTKWVIVSRRIRHEWHFEYKNNLLSRIKHQISEIDGKHIEQDVTTVKYEYGHKKKKK